MNDKKIQIINRIIMLLILLGTLVVSMIDYKPDHLATYFASLPLILVPLLFSKTKLKLEEMDQLVYFAFVFFAYFLGSVVNLYNITWWYDVLMHFASGFVIAYFAFYLLKKLNMYKKENKLFNFIFCISLAIAVAGIWEIAEFLADRVMGSNLQHNLDTGVIDTMEDIICGTIGGLIYTLGRLFKK